MSPLLAVSIIAIVGAVYADTYLWEQFKTNHSKNYKILSEEKHRFGVFQANLLKIEEHNAKYAQGLTKYFLKITQFADLTDEEFANQYLCYRTPRINFTAKFSLPEQETVPDSIDWRKKGAVLEVKNQGNCGSCYAFSTTGALEGQNAIKHNKRVSLSEQELVDCSAGYLNSGCKGGSMMFSFRYVQDYGGISTEKSYPYVGKEEACSRIHGENSGIKVLGYKEIGYDENELKAAVGTVGPVSVAINSQGIKLYGGGIFDDTSCSDDINHGVLVVGYATSENIDYWIIKNSWGTQWGEQGYLRIARNKQLCGLSYLSTYPIIA